MSIATPDISAFGYKQELKRSLGFVDLLAYGLALEGLAITAIPRKPG